MSALSPEHTAAKGMRIALGSTLLSVVLSIVKITAGILGHSYALIADGIESAVDVPVSLMVWSGLRIASRPPDRTHPYGHGKAESIAAVAVALALLAAAALIAVQSVREMMTPHRIPAPFTLVVLLVVIVIKESMYRWVHQKARELNSQALTSDAWHHRSDAVTSLAALAGISLALLGGERWAAADEIAALAACGVIGYNGLRLLRPAVDEVMDAAVPGEVERELRRTAEAVEGVHNVEKCRIRKSGIGLQMDLHVTVDGDMSVRNGHDIAHAVQDALLASSLNVADAVIHIEPHDL